MALDQITYDHLVKSLNQTTKEIHEKNNKDFLELIGINDQLLLAIQRHYNQNTKHPLFAAETGSYIYPLIKTFHNYIATINEASFDQQVMLIPLLLTVFESFNQKVEICKGDSSIPRYYLDHLQCMNTNLQAILTQEPLKAMKEKVNNIYTISQLMGMIDTLKSNISEQKNERQTTRNTPWKLDLFDEIRNKLNTAEQLSDNDIYQYITDIRNVCAMKRNLLHFWAEPHSVAEFELLLASNQLLPEIDENLSLAKTNASYD